MARRLAFLIGNQRFLPQSGLPPLRGPHNDVAALERLLGDPARGCFEVRTFLDQPHYEILPSIEEGMQSARKGDLVLIFYSGHGKPEISSGRLYLATANTRQVALQSTSIPAWSLHEAVQASPCDQVVLLLDCCYSGAVSQGLRGALDSQLQAVQNAAGFYILTASTSIQTASENEEEREGKIMGRFTAAIVDGIETGSADSSRKGRIHLSDLRQHLERTVRGQTPQFFAHAGSGDPLISLSPALLDKSMVADLEAENWHRRRGAVFYLTDVLRESDSPARAEAHAVLKQRLQFERDYDVRRAIEDALTKSEKGPPGPRKPFFELPFYMQAGVGATILGVILVGGSLAWLVTSKPTGQIDGAWKGKSYQTNAELEIKTRRTNDLCPIIDGKMDDLPRSSLSEIKGYYCPSDHRIEFTRSTGSVICQRYKGKVLSNDHIVSMKGTFTVLDECGGSSSREPYDFSFDKQ